MKMIKNDGIKVSISILFVLFLIQGCGTDSNLCDDASRHLASCYDSDPVTIPDCNQETANTLLSMDCAEIQSSSVDSAKADGLGTAWQWIKSIFDGCDTFEGEYADLDRLKRKNDCRECNLKGACLSGADLYFADLEGSDLTDADLSSNEDEDTQTTLANANLEGANLTRTDLTDASLSNARLTGAVMEDTILTNTYIGGATWVDGTVLCEVDGHVDPVEKCTCKEGSSGETCILEDSTPPCIPSVSSDDPLYNRFEGIGADNACETGQDCHISGCNGEVCAAEGVETTCEALFDTPSGDCGCLDGVCQWIICAE
jgi:hypothetical protein